MKSQLLQTASIILMSVERQNEWVVTKSKGAIKELLGTTTLEPLVPVRSFVEQNDFSHFETALEEAVRGRPQTLTLRLAIDKQIRWVNVTISHEDEETELLIDRIQSHSARLMTTDALAEVYTAITERPDFHKIIVETVNDGIMVNDPQGQMVFVNGRLADLLGYEVSEILGRHLFDLMDDDEQQATEARLQRRREGIEETFDVRFKHRNGHDVWCQGCAQPMVDASGIHLGSLVALADISGRKDAEGELRNILEELEDRVKARTADLELQVQERVAAETEARESSRAKSSFLANMSHELRTPLNIIMGNTEILQDALPQSDRSKLADRSITRIYDAAEHLLELVGDILDLSRIEADRMAFHWERIPVPPLLEDLTQMVGALASTNGNEFEIDDLLGKIEIRTDRLRLRQILLNGLSNACKFTDRGTITLSARRSGRPDLPYCFEVIDTGVGISAEALKKLFSAFTQEDESFTREHGGAGLGLALSRRLAELMGGQLTLRSTKGVGTTFSLLLPRSPPKEPS